MQAALCHADWPDLKVLNQRWQALAPPHSHVYGFIEQPAGRRYSAIDYELSIFADGWIPTRRHSLHDLFNALVWLRWPLSKLALNRAHAEDLKRYGRDRNRRRDALTLLDEAGVLIISGESAPLQALAEHQWQAVWWDERQRWLTDCQWHIFGHGLLEQCQAPYIGLTGKAWLIRRSVLNGTSLDAWLAARIEQADFHHPHQLSPLPLLGIPGLWPDNATLAFYQQTDYFRPASQRRPAAPVWR